MIQHFRVFNFDLEKEIEKIERGKVFNSDETNDERFREFFRSHLDTSSTDPKSKHFRFNSIDEGMLNHSLKTFDSQELFEESTSRIADKLLDNIDKRKFKQPFYLVTFTVVDEPDIDDLLAILIMDTNPGVQIVNTNKYNILENMLPGVKTKLQKCAFIYKNNCENFKHGREEHERIHHSLILDRKGTYIAQYFMKNFMESKIIADDGTNTLLAEKAIKQVASNFLRVDTNKEDLENSLRSVLARNETVTYESLFNSINNHLDLEKLEERGEDIESLSLEAYEMAIRENPTAQQEFSAKLPVIPRIVVKDIEDPKKLKISIAKEYIEMGYVKINEEDKDYLDIKVAKDIIETEHVD